MTGPRPALYTEAHSALNRALLARYLLAPAAAETACLIAGVAFGQPWFFVIMGWLIVPIMIWSALAYRNWPTGIRVDEAAVSIGAITSARAVRRTPTVNHQSWGLFTCPWPAVRGLRIVTDRDELRQIKNSPRYYTFTNRWGARRGMGHCNIGVLASPFMRAALVIDVDPDAATASRIRPARFYDNYLHGYLSRRTEPRLSPVWVCPPAAPKTSARPSTASTTTQPTAASRGRDGSAAVSGPGGKPGKRAAAGLVANDADAVPACVLSLLEGAVGGSEEVSEVVPGMGRCSGDGGQDRVTGRCP